MRYKMLQKQLNSSTTWKVAQNFFFSKGCDKLLYRVTTSYNAYKKLQKVGMGTTFKVAQ